MINRVARVLRNKPSAFWIDIVIKLGFLVAAYMLSQLIVKGKYRYGYAALFLMVFVYLSLIRRYWETVMVLIWGVYVVWTWSIGGGYWVFFGIRWNHFEFLFAGMLAIQLGLTAVEPQRISLIRPVSSQRMINVFLIGYLCTLFLSSLTGTNVIMEIRNWMLLGLEGVLAFIVMSRALSGEQQARRFALVLLIMVLLLSIEENIRYFLGISFLRDQFQYQGLPVTAMGRYRFGLFSTKGITGFLDPFPNVDATLFMVLLPLSLAMFLQKWQTRIRVLALCAFCSFLVNVLMPLDRGNWLGALVGLGLIVYYKRKYWSRVLLSGMLVCSLVLGLLIYSGIWVIGGPFSMSEVFMSDRWNLWANTLEALPHFPLLTGIGFGSADTFALTLAKYSSYGYRIEYTGPGREFYGQYSQPHNAFLQVLTSAGIPTFLFFVALVGFVSWYALRALGQGRQDPRWWVLLGVASGLISFLAEAMFNRQLWMYPLNFLFWMLLGATWGLAADINRRLQQIRSGS